jgi:hypothetical protein
MDVGHLAKIPYCSAISVESKGQLPSANSSSCRQVPVGICKIGKDVKKYDQQQNHHI